MSIDSSERLAFSLTGSPGTYALLLGSGISSAAMIPTGWRITEDLIKQIAKMRRAEEAASENPAAWYSNQFKKEPNYSALVEELGNTNSDRQSILDRYIEPDEQDLEQGWKLPTAAHKAVAKLAKLGVIRIIITTNFDRLLENALVEGQVPFAVISSPDDIDGMQPLSHSQGVCQVIKLHGDYKDSRILNTEEELKQYDERTDRLLDRIFDEFGIVVCGWSADWDIALRKAIRRCSTRRFGWYWTHRGETGEAADQIIQLRDAQRIPIEDAESFFTSLLDKVEALQEHNRPHPDSTALAVAMLKRFLPSPEDRIRLTDLITERTQTAAEAIRTAGEIRASKRQEQGRRFGVGLRNPHSYGRRRRVLDGGKAPTRLARFAGNTPACRDGLARTKKNDARLRRVARFLEPVHRCNRPGPTGHRQVYVRFPSQNRLAEATCHTRLVFVSAQVGPAWDCVPAHHGQLGQDGRAFYVRRPGTVQIVHRQIRHLLARRKRLQETPSGRPRTRRFTPSLQKKPTPCECSGKQASPNDPRIQGIHRNRGARVTAGKMRPIWSNTSGRFVEP